MRTDKLLSILLTFFPIKEIFGTNIKIPSRMIIMNTQVFINESGKKIIREKMNNISKVPRNLSHIVHNAKIYANIVNKILKQESIPTDGFYIMLLESHGDGGAVAASTKATGYWQFKEKAALESGLIINSHIDERKHIILSTYGFCKYLKILYKSLDNWMWAIMGFYSGAGGTKKFIKQNNLKIYTNKIHITKSSHFYLQLFIAYKLLIDKYIGIVKMPIKLTVKKCNNMTVNSICKKYNIDKELFMKYNRWILKSRIPKKNRCKVIIPCHQ